ncbi:MAG: hypothetical protein NXI01_05245 [Gammaproteobacteria bacterium]|nr:hypothetical protein [Gammaproteobacteria bacterium]
MHGGSTNGGEKYRKNGDRLPISTYLKYKKPLSSTGTGFGSAPRAAALVTLGFGLSALSVGILAQDPYLAVLSSFHFPVVLLITAIVVGVAMFMCGLYMAMTLRDRRNVASRSSEVRMWTDSDSEDSHNETASPTCFERFLSCCS